MTKSKLFKSIMCTGLAITVAVGAVGCSATQGKEVHTETKIEKMEAETPAKFGFNAIGGTDVMPIMGFFSPVVSSVSWNANPMPDYLSDDMFNLMNECGINVIGPGLTDYINVPNFVIRMLEQGEKHGIGVLVSDHRIMDETLSIEEVDSYINEYANYSSFVGMHLVDEPATNYFRTRVDGISIDQYDEIYKNIHDLGYYAHTTLLGMENREGYTESDVKNFHKYINEWVNSCEPEVLVYDRYIYYGNEGMKYAKTYFKTMEGFRSAAEEQNVPFWVTVEAGQQFNDAKEYFDSEEYYPSQGEFYWNVGTILAFGAKGLMYFPMIQPTWFAYAKTDMFDFQRNGLIGAWGNKTRWFCYAKDMNAQIAAIDDVLMNSVNKGVIASGELAQEHLSDCKYLMEGTSWRELTGVSGDAMIGCFNYQGKTALYVVNYDTEYAQKINLDFADNYNIRVVQNAETEYLSCDNLELTFAAGDSALIVFE